MYSYVYCICNSIHRPMFLILIQRMLILIKCHVRRRPVRRSSGESFADRSPHALRKRKHQNRSKFDPILLYDARVCVCVCRSHHVLSFGLFGAALQHCSTTTTALGCVPGHLSHTHTPRRTQCGQTCQSDAGPDRSHDARTAQKMISRSFNYNKRICDAMQCIASQPIRSRIPGPPMVRILHDVKFVFFFFFLFVLLSFILVVVVVAFSLS